jgi:hypothetical protein
VADQIRLVDITRPNVEMERLADQVYAAIEQFEPDVHRRVALLQARQRRCHHLATEPRTRADSHWPLRVAGAPGDVFAHVFHVIEDALCPRQYLGAFVGHADLASRAAQQLHSERPLEQRNTLAHQGLRHAGLARPGHEAGLPRYEAEQTQVLQGWITIHDAW